MAKDQWVYGLCCGSPSVAAICNVSNLYQNIVLCLGTVLQIYLPANMEGKARENVQRLGPLTPAGQLGLSLRPGFSRTQLWLLWPCWEWTNRWKNSVSSSLCHSVFLKKKNQQAAIYHQLIGTKLIILDRYNRVYTHIYNTHSNSTAYFLKHKVDVEYIAACMKYKKHSIRYRH